jgi:hypothetical protein
MDTGPLPFRHQKETCCLPVCGEAFAAVSAHLQLPCPDDVCLRPYDLTIIGGVCQNKKQRSRWERVIFAQGVLLVYETTSV